MEAHRAGGPSRTLATSVYPTRAACLDGSFSRRRKGQFLGWVLSVIYGVIPPGPTAGRPSLGWDLLGPTENPHGDVEWAAFSARASLLLCSVSTWSAAPRVTL